MILIQFRRLKGKKINVVDNIMIRCTECTVVKACFCFCTTLFKPHLYVLFDVWSSVKRR